MLFYVVYSLWKLGKVKNIKQTLTRTKSNQYQQDLKPSKTQQNIRGAYKSTNRNVKIVRMAKPRTKPVCVAIAMRTETTTQIQLKNIEDKKLLINYCY